MKNEKEISTDPKGEALKKKHNAKAVYKLELENEDGKKFTGWIRKPNLDEIGAFVSLSQANPVKGAQVLLNSTWLEGDEEIKTDEELFLGVMAVLDNLIKVRVAKVSKF